MGQSVLVFISHSSEDKTSFIEPLVNDLENCYINVWLDKRKIVPGDNLRKSIFRDGLDKADVALIFFTENSLKSAWVDKEIKHVLREELKSGNDFDLSKIISIFDSEETYEEISKRYPELTDDLLHLMPVNYNKTQLSQLVSAIWSKYLSLQGGDTKTQKQLLAKDRELFKREKEIQDLKTKLIQEKEKNSASSMHEEYEDMLNSEAIDEFIKKKDRILKGTFIPIDKFPDVSPAIAFGLARNSGAGIGLTDKGRDFLSWYILNQNSRRGQSTS